MKNIINWNYERASWQWDVLCVVCLVFIFLTPKAWFDKSASPANQTAPPAVKQDDRSRGER